MITALLSASNFDVVILNVARHEGEDAVARSCHVLTPIGIFMKNYHKSVKNKCPLQ